MSLRLLYEFEHDRLQAGVDCCYRSMYLLPILIAVEDCKAMQGYYRIN